MSSEEIFIDIPQIPLEEQEKYVGMDVAIVNGKVITSGHSSVEVYERARELFPDKDPEEIVRLQLLLSPWYEIRSKVCLFSTILRVYAQEIAENRTKIERIQLLGDRSDCTQIVIRYITRPGTLIL